MKIKKQPWDWKEMFASFSWCWYVSSRGEPRKDRIDMGILVDNINRRECQVGSLHAMFNLKLCWMFYRIAEGT